MRVIVILDQIQAGLGTKDDKDLPLGLDNKCIGPAVLLKPYMRKLDAEISHCIYCGTGFYFKNEQKILEKLKSVLEKAAPDIVICGPSYNYSDYSMMSAHIASYLKKETNIEVICAMSKENKELINEYKHQITILEMPKKGDGGLSQVIEELSALAIALIQHKDLTDFQIYR